ncbi:MAG: hypothetical protein SOU50_06625 [Oscillospiraceae bacterium]|nr:hypothetical protein [Oscillospiraceae bacterium]
MIRNNILPSVANNKVVCNAASVQANVLMLSDDGEVYFSAE